MAIPVRGCQHVGTTYERLSARCPRCGALWERSPSGPWRCVDPGSEPGTELTFRCEGCGAGYRERPRTCFACGRPSAGIAADRSPEELDELVRDVQRGARP